MTSDLEPGAPIPADHVVFTDLDGVEGVLVDLETRQYYRLNETASVIWQGLSCGTSIEEIARALTNAYDVTEERAHSSIEAALGGFKARRLLQTA